MRWMRPGTITGTILLLSGLAGCGEEEGLVGLDPHPPAGPVLSEDLSSNCYRWPGGPFTKQNFAYVHTSMAPGELAVDFELEDVEGNSYRLSELLLTKPVLLVLGSFT
jgi:hypothetical protein